MQSTNTEKSYPILYSFRRCPYAMRARMALINANIHFILREIDLKDKHPSFLSTSPKGTVPVLILADGTIIDESLDVVDYIFSIQPKTPEPNEEEKALIDQLNASVTSAIHCFKYHERYSADEVLAARDTIEQYLNQLNNYQGHDTPASRDDWSKADIIVLPFVRQIYRSNPDYFQQLPYNNMKEWLHNIIDSDRFHAVMTRCPALGKQSTTRDYFNYHRSQESKHWGKRRMKNHETDL